MPITMIAMNIVPPHPIYFSDRRTMNVPMMSRRQAICIVTTITGTASTSLVTALALSALIGSIGAKLTIMPTNVAIANVA